EGPESVVFVRDAAGRVIGTMPMRSAERIIAFLRRETEASSSVSGAAEELGPARLELRTQGSESRELTPRQQEEREVQERQETEQRRAGELAETRREPVLGERGVRQIQEDQHGDRVVVRTNSADALEHEGLSR